MSESTLSIEEMERLENFFGQFSKAFDSPTKKGIFLVGVLVQKLIYPFRMLKLNILI
jgi:hypothetical protein